MAASRARTQLSKNSTNTSLRCKPGDIAVVLSRLNLGKIVRVERPYADPKEVISGSLWSSGPLGKDFGPAWVVSTLAGPLKSMDEDGVPGLKTHMTAVIGDVFLRPLRDSDGSDESLTWSPASKTRKTTATKAQGASRTARGRMHKPEPKLSSDQQDKRSVIPIEVQDVDQWSAGTVSEAKTLLQVPEVDVFRAAPLAA